MKHPSTSTIMIIIFLIVFSGHFASKVTTSSDSVWMIHTAANMIRYRTTDLDTYRSLMKPNDYRIEVVDNHYYNVYSIGTPIVAVPFVYLIGRISKAVLSFDLYEYLDRTVPVSGLELLIASLLVAMTTVVIYLIAFELLADARLALLVAFIFAFCTSAWSTASRALWQHGPSLLILSTVLYLIVLARRRPWLIILAGPLLAFGCFVRPTDGLSALVLTLFVTVHYRRYLLPYLLLAALSATPILIYTYSIRHTVLPIFYLQRVSGQSHFLEALAGNLISPGRGLFVFTPILLLSLGSIWLKLKRRELRDVDPYLIAIILAHWVVISRWSQWWAGWAYGPRMFTDMLPYLIYFAIPMFGLFTVLRGRKRVALVSVTAVLIAVSFAIHYRGANSTDTWWWNGRPTEIDAQPGRVWDWQDLQFLRGLG